MTRGREEKKQIRQTHWNNLSDLILHPWLQEAHQLSFGSSCFPCMWLSLMLGCFSSVAPRPSITKQLLEELHVKCIRQTWCDIQYCFHITLLAVQSILFIVLWDYFYLKNVARSHRANSLTNMPLSTLFSTGLTTHTTGQIKVFQLEIWTVQGKINQKWCKLLHDSYCCWRGAVRFSS